MKKYIFFLLIALMVSTRVVFAQITVDGIRYTFNSNNKTAQVIARAGVGYSGTIVIPPFVTYSQKTFKVTGIESQAFGDCPGLTSLTIGENVEKIWPQACWGCSNLTTITILSNALVSTEYSNTSNFRTIFGTQVQKYIIGKSVKSIGKYAFDGCKSLTSVTIPNSVTSIGRSAFQNCTGLTSITIPNTVTYIGWHAFGGCKGLTTITIPNSVTTIEFGTFSACTGLTSVTIPNSVTSIGNEAFHGCTSLMTATIPNSVTSLGNWVFAKCTSLTSITIPNSVTSIGMKAFNACTGLTYFTCEAVTPPELGTDVFMDVPCSSIPLYVPAQSVSDYKAAEQWKNFNPILPIGFVGYTITFNNWDGNELLKLTGVEHGTMPVYTGNTPTRPDDAFYTYTFKGWSPNIVEATQDATYVAVYDEHPRTTDIKEVSAKTDVIKSLRDCKLVIERDGKTYTVQGQEVK